LLEDLRESSRRLQKAKEFIPFEMLESIPDPEQTTTKADIELLLREALISTIAADVIDPALDSMEIIDSTLQSEVQEADYIASQADFVEFDTEYDYLDADDDADTGLF
jgi:hypothetical protein